jgi:hypothetical protein
MFSRLKKTLPGASNDNDPLRHAPPGARVLSLEWNDGDAWRVAIETIHSGRWESRAQGDGSSATVA